MDVCVILSFISERQSFDLRRHVHVQLLIRIKTFTETFCLHKHMQIIATFQAKF